MPARVPDIDLADVRYLAPPYENGEGGAPSNGGLRGTVAIFRPRASAVEYLRGVQGHVAAERIDNARAVVLHLDRTPHEAAYIALAAYPIGVRAILLGELDVTDLRRQLARPPDPWQDWAEWVGLRHGVGDRSLLAVLSRLMALGAAQLEFRDAEKRLSTAGRTLRRHARAQGLPSPQWWFYGARLPEAQLRLQRDPDLTVSKVALAFGYADAMSFSNRCVRVFGATAETARKCLGLEWRFQAWWERARRQSQVARSVRQGV